MTKSELAKKYVEAMHARIDAENRGTAHSHKLGALKRAETIADNKLVAFCGESEAIQEVARVLAEIRKSIY